MSETKKINVWDALLTKFPCDQYALMAEVSDAAGFYRSNSADYIAVGLWPSRGLNIHGIELKSNRGDWLKELKTPKKAENIFQHCDFFWLLTIDDTIAKAEEIPTTWGWLYIKNGKIRVKKDAPKLSPGHVDKHFLAAMLKRACDRRNYVHVNSLDEKINQLVEQKIRDQTNKLEYLQSELSDINKKVKAFELHSGLDIRNTWDAEGLGKRVAMVKNHTPESFQNEIIRIKNNLGSLITKIQSSIAKLEDGTQ